MNAERGMGMEGATIVALSIPFAIGVAAAAMTPGLTARCGYVAAALCMSAAAALLALYCRSGERKLIIYFAYALLGYLCWVSSAICGNPGHKLPDFAGIWLGKLLEVIDTTGFSSPQTPALLKALLTGQKGDLPTETVQAFRASGASHILALSGLHLGIIYACISGCLKTLGNSRAAMLARSILTIAACGLYTLITGAGASTVRAFLFIFMGEISRLQPGRVRNPSSVLCTALMVQLCFEPSAISSVGFQLSYLAMMGIFVLFPALDGWYPASSRLNPIKKIWTSIALSLSCQIFTAPVVWAHFHTFPKYFLLTNLIALPLTEALMITSVGTLAMSAAGFCPETAKALVECLAKALVFCLNVISDL